MCLICLFILYKNNQFDLYSAMENFLEKHMKAKE